MTESNSYITRQPEIAGLDSPAASLGRTQTRRHLTRLAAGGAHIARSAGAPAITRAIGFCSHRATMVAVSSRRLVGTLLGLGLGMVLGALTLVSPAWAAGVNGQSFTPPGGPYTYTVPAGVTSVHVDAIGGAGGSSSDGNPGGEGADVAADLPVTSGEAHFRCMSRVTAFPILLAIPTPGRERTAVAAPVVSTPVAGAAPQMSAPPRGT
jgi:hypothetical protein